MNPKDSLVAQLEACKQFTQGMRVRVVGTLKFSGILGVVARDPQELSASNPMVYSILDDGRYLRSRPEYLELVG